MLQGNRHNHHFSGSDSIRTADSRDNSTAIALVVTADGTNAAPSIISSPGAFSDTSEGHAGYDDADGIIPELQGLAKFLEETPMSPLHLASGSPVSTESNPIFAQDPAPLHLPAAALSTQPSPAAFEVPQAAVQSSSRPLATAAEPPARLLSYPNLTRMRAPPSQSQLPHPLANVRQAQALMFPSPAAAPASRTELGARLPASTPPAMLFQSSLILPASANAWGTAAAGSSAPRMASSTIAPASQALPLPPAYLRMQLPPPAPPLPSHQHLSTSPPAFATSNACQCCCHCHFKQQQLTPPQGTGVSLQGGVPRNSMHQVHTLANTSTLAAAPPTSAAPLSSAALPATAAAASGSPAKAHLLVMPKVGVAWSLKSCDKPRHQQPLGPKTWQQPQPHQQPNQPMAHQHQQLQRPQHGMLQLQQGQPQRAMQQELRPQQQRQAPLLQVPLPAEQGNTAERKQRQEEVVGGASGAAILGGRSPPLPPPPCPPPSKYPAGPLPKLTPFLLSAIANSKANASALSLVQQTPVTLPAVASMSLAPASLQPVMVSALPEVAAMPTLHLNAVPDPPFLSLITHLLPDHPPAP
ncbi:unnamed protein product [Closterium sp. Naga37s-1]|nr:unnamed protein product [Closterium sp. Naga37s-1]